MGASVNFDVFPTGSGESFIFRASSLIFLRSLKQGAGGCLQMPIFDEFLLSHVRGREGVVLM